ncbi:MAG: allophycocyanin [Cyanobacteria bacterium CRU_2_1]|nr:allophycocyanin [Cyanobacteria bacterium RU_5_0]NJR61194.1 allophycocyanin [Cyanobacteria bacterium CRU_2_1]
MSIITQAITSADREARYLNVEELNSIRDFYEGGQNRLRIAAVLSTHERQIVQKGSQTFWERCPVTPSNSGNRTFQASCMRDQGWYVRLVTYAIVVGDIEPIEKSGIKGAKEMYISLGVPLRNLVECMRCLKEAALDLLSLDDVDEVAPYFDYIIQGMKP